MPSYTFHKALNNATTTTAGAANIGVTSLTVTSGAVFGSTFPLWATVTRAGTLVTTVEVTARATNTLTLTRGVDGVPDADIHTGDTIACYDNAGLWTELQTALGGLVPKGYAASIGDGAATSYTVTHNLGTKDVVVSFRKTADDTAILTNWTAATTNTITVTFTTAPTSNAIRVIIIGF